MTHLKSTSITHNEFINNLNMSQTTNILGKESQRDVNLYYEISKNLLGKGSYGKVHLGYLKGTNIQRAIKIIEKSKVKNVERFKLEVEIMMKLDHPNVLRLYDYFEDKKNVYLILELCSGGELFDRIIEKKYYNETEARVIFKQIMKAIIHCHKQGVCHRDLKPENFIMISKNDPYTLKLIDFGLSRTFDSKDDMILQAKKQPENIPQSKRQTRAVLVTKAGTPFYIAPEVLTGNYNEKCDVWSAGVILYILFCGYPPFYGESNKQILEEVKRGKLDFSSIEWSNKSTQAIDIIKKMVVNHEVRLFADEVLKHEWMACDKEKKISSNKVKKLFSNMKDYSKLDFARRTMIYFLARNFYEEEIAAYHKYFDLFDPTSQGCISLENFKNVFVEHLKLPSEEIEQVFKNIDIFERGTLGYSQFIASAIHYSKYFTEKRLLVFFQLADLDKSGKISQDNLDRFLSIQFKHRNNVSDEFKVKAINDFKRVGALDNEFLKFAKIFI